MVKKSFRIILVALLLSLMVVNTAFASPGIPVGGCPTGYMLHPFEMHEGHMDLHVGIVQDLNGDGWICVQHLSSGWHVHLDNVLRLR